MEQFPEIPDLADAPAVVERGHVWVTELVAGDPLRFRVLADGRVEFGDRQRVFGTSVPPEREFAARHVRTSLDRRALAAAVEDPTDYTFFAVATRRKGLDYDWERLPPVVGVGVHDGRAGTLRPPDAAHGIFDRLGLAPVEPVAREVAARDFDADDYATPGSAYHDGPAKGVVIANKAGGLARRHNPAFPDEDSATGRPGSYDSADELAAAFATDERIRRALEEHDAADAADAVYDLVVCAAHPHVFGRGGVDRERLRSAVATRVYERVGDG